MGKRKGETVFAPINLAGLKRVVVITHLLGNQASGGMQLRHITLFAFFREADGREGNAQTGDHHAKTVEYRHRDAA